VDALIPRQNVNKLLGGDQKWESGLEGKITLKGLKWVETAFLKVGPRKKVDEKRRKPQENLPVSDIAGGSKGFLKKGQTGESVCYLKSGGSWISCQGLLKRGEEIGCLRLSPKQRRENEGDKTLLLNEFIIKK